MNNKCTSLWKITLTGCLKTTCEITRIIVNPFLSRITRVMKENSKQEFCISKKGYRDLSSSLSKRNQKIRRKWLNASRSYFEKKCWRRIKFNVSSLNQSSFMIFWKTRRPHTRRLFIASWKNLIRENRKMMNWVYVQLAIGMLFSSKH